jgi:hypothetical protein
MKSIARLVLVLSALTLPSQLFAEPADVPHTFTPNTPAKASEVNDNFSALKQALGKVKQFGLYQNNVKIGSSYLLNIISINNTGYLVAPVKEKQSANVYLTNALGNALYYSSNNCSGSAYIRGKSLDRLDLLGGEKGVVAPIGNAIYSLNIEQTATTNLYVNSFAGSDGQCVDISAYQLPSQSHCQSEVSGIEGARVIERPYTPKRVQCSNGIPYLGACQQNQWVLVEDPATYNCQLLGDEGGYPVPSLLDTQGYNNGVWFPSVKLAKGLGRSGVLASAYLVTPNNPQITGISAAMCTDTKGKPHGCVTNGELKRE